MVLNSMSFLVFIIPGLLLRIDNVNSASILNSLPEEKIFARENPEYLLRMYPRLRSTYNIVPDEDDDSWTDSKRGLDLGLGRGYSGSLAAKQRIGWAAANFAGGPGRRRRNGYEA
ncbi:diuretic hormone class 2 [Harmonia axyridis]|uniref:diuretic hormone class 2 n=1 Tax=Harmonia axyridis TaxID=115357 RepID=UPI001E2761C3|nr:diuretic hormone class 2 [Harmonia axyridis]